MNKSYDNLTTEEKKERNAKYNKARAEKIKKVIKDKLLENDDEHDTGPRTFKCKHCKALHFKGEQVN